MKKMLTLVMFVTTIVSYTLHGQELTSKGLVGGLNLSNVSSDEIEKNSPKLGFALGGFLTFKLGEKFALRPEVYYTNKGYISEFEISSLSSQLDASVKYVETFSLNYIEIPLLGVFSLTKNLNVFAGPYLDFFLSGELEIKIDGHYNTNDTGVWEYTNLDGSDSEDINSDDINSIGYGLTFGGEYLIGQFSIGARYSLGLSNIPDESVIQDENVWPVGSVFDSKHINIQLLVGFYF